MDQDAWLNKTVTVFQNNNCSIEYIELANLREIGNIFNYLYSNTAI